MPKILRPALLAGLLAALVAAEPTAPGFTFTGCVSADPKQFQLTIAFFAPFTSLQCQEAASSRDAKWAALGQGGCHCDDPHVDANITFTVVDNARCSVLCIRGHEESGHCGGPEQAGSVQLFDLFERN